MKRALPTDIRNLSNLSFEDYIRLNEVIKQDGKLPTETVSQHNTDMITYEDAYKAMKDLANNLAVQNQQTTNYVADLFSSLSTLLVKKGIITEQELVATTKIAQKIWEEENKDDKKDIN